MSGRNPPVDQAGDHGDAEAVGRQKRLRRAVAASLCGSILHARNSGLFGTVGTAKGLVLGLNPVADDAAAAMRAPWRHALNCTFETVECHATRTLSDNHRLVIVVSTHVTRRHMSHLSALKRPPFSRLKSANQCGRLSAFRLYRSRSAKYCPTRPAL